MNIDDLIKRAHETAVEKGWWDIEQPLENQIVNIHAELSEAWEEWRNNRGLNEIHYSVYETMDSRGTVNKDCKPEGIPIELADVVIRICDTLGRYKKCKYSDKSYIPSYETNFAKFINKCHYGLTLADNEDTLVNLFVIIFEIYTFCDQNGIDLEKAIEIKMAYNKSRPYRHGGKKA